MITVKELREFINQYGDDIEVKVYLNINEGISAAIESVDDTYEGGGVPIVQIHLNEDDY